MAVGVVDGRVGGAHFKGYISKCSRFYQKVGFSTQSLHTLTMFSCKNQLCSNLLLVSLYFRLYLQDYYKKLDNHKQTQRPHCQNHLRSILQSNYVEDSQKLLKDLSAKPRIHALGLQSASTYQGEQLDSVECCDPS